MKIILNNIRKDLEGSLTVGELKKRINSQADITIVNTFPVSDNYLIKDGDNIIFIKRGDTPEKEDLEYMIAARHGLDIWERLKKTSVAIAGLGGLGSHCALSLARMGIGRLKLIDFDIVEPSNINRQCYFIDQLGERKTAALKANIERINPFITIETEDAFVDASNIKSIFGGFDVIIEAFDSADSKIILIEEASACFPDSFIIGASGVAGYFNTDEFVKKRLGKNCIVIGDFKHGAGNEMGLMAARVAVAANIQANEAVRYLLKEK